MSAAIKLLADFHAQGVGVRLQGGSVMVTAPKGAVTDAQVSTLRQCKAEIITILEAANDQPAEVGIPAAVEPSDGYKPFDWGPADDWTAKYRRNPLRGTGDEAPKAAIQTAV